MHTQLIPGAPMPELPEVEALAHHLREHALYRPVARVDVASMSAVKTFDPPVSALAAGWSPARRGTASSCPSSSPTARTTPLHLITHLSRAGWLRWHDTAAATPPKPGRGPLELRVHLDAVGGPGFDLTEAGTQKRLSVYLVPDPQQVPGIARLGPDALALTRDEFAALLAGRTERIKTLIVEQQMIAGDRQRLQRRDPAHRAALAVRRRRAGCRPSRSTSCTPRCASVLTDAVERSVGQGAAAAQGREALRPAGARAHRAAVPGVRRHRAGGLLRQPVVPVLSRLPDRRQAARRPAAVAAGEVGR